MRTKKVSFFDESASEERAPLLSPSKGHEQQAAVRQTLEGDAIVELEGLSRFLVVSCKVFTVASCLCIVLGALKSGYVESMDVLWCTVPVWLACLWFAADMVLSLVRVRRVMLDEEWRRMLSVRRMRRRRLRRKNSWASPQGQQQQQQQQHERGIAGREKGAAGGGGGGGDKDDGSGVDDGGAGPSSPQPLRRPLLARAPSSRLRRHVSRGTAASATTPSPSASAGKGEEDGETAEDWWGRGESDDGSGGRGGGRQIGTAAPSTPESQQRLPARVTISYDGGDDDDGDGDDDDASTTLFFPTPAEKFKSSSLKSPPSPPPQPPSTPGKDPRREVQISFLLQAWLRLWVTMAFFAVVLTASMALLSLRLLGFQAVSAGCIGSPCILALAFLGLHSLLLLDGSGGVGGGPAMRGGGSSRPVVGLGRRPVILLAFVTAVLVVLKVDSAAADTTTASGTWAVAVLVGKVRWGLVFLPLWVMVFWLEVVYVVALWENYAGRSVTRSLFGGAKDYRGGVDGPGHGHGHGLGCCLDGSTGGYCDRPRWLWWQGSREKGEYGRLEDDGLVGHRQQGAAGRGAGTTGELRRREQHQQHEPTDESAACLSYSSGVAGVAGVDVGGSGFRRRVELSPSQRAAASSIAAGLFLLTMTVITVTIGSGRVKASWGVPFTFLAAAAGMALVGAGFVSLASAYDRLLRGPLPPVVKPLPVFFSERDGGWVVGPPDSPVVSVFLLGDVTLRLEDRGFGWGGGGDGGGDSGSGVGEAAGDVCWSSTC